jgi:hypothetical protein
LFKVYWTFKQAVVKANIWGFSGSCVWTWYPRWAVSSSFSRRKIENKSEISGNLIAWLPNRGIIGPTSEREVWMD